MLIYTLVSTEWKKMYFLFSRMFFFLQSTFLFLNFKSFINYSKTFPLQWNFHLEDIPFYVFCFCFINGKDIHIMKVAFQDHYLFTQHLESCRAHKGVRGTTTDLERLTSCKVLGSQQRQIKEDFLEHPTSQLGFKIKRLAKMSISRDAKNGEE